MKCSGSSLGERASQQEQQQPSETKTAEVDTSNSKKNSGALFYCTVCYYVSDKSANLSRHKRTMHETAMKPVNCCGVGFSSKADYRLHNKTFHKNGHNCPQCGKSFSRRALLKRHLSVHTGIKDFKCEFCHYRSSHKSNVVRHLKVHRGMVSRVHNMGPVRRQPEPDSTSAAVPTGRPSTGNIITSAGSPGNQDILRQPQTQEPARPNIASEDKETEKKVIKHSIESILQKEGTITDDKELNELSPVSSNELNETEQPGEGNFRKEGGEKETLKKSCTTGAMNGGKEWESRLLPPPPPYPHQRTTVANNMLINEMSNYTHANMQSNYLAPIDVFPATNWMRNSSSLCFPPLSSPSVVATSSSSLSSSSTSPTAVSPYPFPSGFGSIFGLEESRYLSSPHLQSAPGRLPVGWPAGSSSRASAFRHPHRQPLPLLSGYGPLGPLPHFPLGPFFPSPHMFNMSSNSAVDLSARRNNQLNTDVSASTRTTLTAPEAATAVAAGGIHTDLSQVCLLRQLTNAQMAYFVSY